MQLSPSPGHSAKRAPHGGKTTGQPYLTRSQQAWEDLVIDVFGDLETEDAAWYARYQADGREPGPATDGWIGL